MSSMRNAVQRRNHKERAQPLEREKWGILEKHKDYSLRAKDHNEKKRRIKVLREKAAERNPDEFAFGMMSATSVKGVRVTQRSKDNGQSGPLNMDVVKLLKTQDAGYLQTVLQQTRNERERVEKEVVLVSTGVDSSKSSKKKVFDDNGMEMTVPGTKTIDDDDDDDDLFSDDDVSIGEVADDEKNLTKEQIQRRRRRRRAQDALQSRLEALKNREKELGAALSTLQHQRAKMNNVVGGVNKNGVKFKVRERKR